MGARALRSRPLAEIEVAGSRAITTALKTDVGRQRKSNQDACARFARDDGSVLLVCCDGMGGHQGGEVASQLAASAIGAAFASRSEGEPAARLTHALQAANRRILERASLEPQLRGMGTTAVALYYDGRSLAWLANVGDSRGYRLRNGKLEQLTRDHSVVAELIRRGRISAAEAARVPSNQLSRAIGVDPAVEIDCAQHDVRDGDRWLLCSDGLWNLVAEREIAECLARDDPEAAAAELVESANQQGGGDNITVVLLAVGSTGAAAAESSQTLESDGEPSRPRSRRALRFAALGALAVILGLAALVWLDQSRPAP